MSAGHNTSGLRHGHGVEDAGQRVLDGMSPAQIAEAYRAAQTEHKMGFKQAVRVYWKGLFWSAIMSVVSAYQTHLLEQVG